MQHWCEMWMYSKLKETGKNVRRTWWFLWVSWKELDLCSSPAGGLCIRRFYSQASCVGHVALLARCRGIRNTTLCKRESDQLKSNLPMISKDSLLLSIRNHVLVRRELWFEKRITGRMFMNCAINEFKVNVPYDFAFLKIYGSPFLV